MANEEDLQVTKSLRREIIERIRLRTQINWFKIAALGVLVSWDKEAALWALPFVAISFDLAILHNANYIHQTGDFLARYPWWREFETRPGQKRWVRIKVDLADRASYLIITVLAIFYAWFSLRNSVTSPHWLKCWWIGLILLLSGIEFWLACISLIRWPAEERPSAGKA